MLDGILTGLQTAIMPTNLMMVVLGCFVGTFIGMLPGLGPVSAIALMIPITYGIDPSSGIILMAGVYYGAIFGGSTSSILINAPGCSGTGLLTRRSPAALFPPFSCCWRRRCWRRFRSVFNRPTTSR
jgi:TctA family transporter